MQTLKSLALASLVALSITMSAVAFHAAFGNGVRGEKAEPASPNNRQQTVAEYHDAAMVSNANSRPYVTGPLASKVGELCVFNLSDPKIQADWAVIRQSSEGPPVNAYIDSSGSSVVFSSNVACNYTVVAAVAESGTPKILQHVCEYGVTPEPKPNPKPQPPPILLGEWVSQNIPDVGKSEAKILASVYESASQGIERATIKTSEAAFSIIRTNTQTKIKIAVWSDFLDRLSEKITEKLGENRDVKELGTIFLEIAEGLKGVSGVPVMVSTVPVPRSNVVNHVVMPRVQNTRYYSAPTCYGPNCTQPHIHYGGRP